jgi:hypothetical protein
MALHGFFKRMALRFALVHRKVGPLATFDTAVEAAKEMVRVLQNEPECLDDLRIELCEAGSAVTGPDGKANIRS